ncbi:hypothetical protein BU24DRAFT_418728 [Aaosphaeria arxii CBS 175.79]|uniref:Inclusion body clearance protein IML2 n=1 Tax=Aaosphaeria arxii CBS 175.79 TaxID=1450172 RepID=A0A6A5Y258_9PLEO|nr:uncharacterized protein BU24DRAFT_418728 [Aaosphaeria arxii CBS 175.79]KAF2019127.1 hypothetical protein BU24DRAFT_418728 [Aaosphaeria arxii CBS 175.79]
MLKVGGWLGGGGKFKHGHTRSLNALDELNQIEDAMAAVTHIMNDDVNAAEEHLNKGSSPFHQLGKGVVTFMRATLGFEQEIMREASQTLSDAENSAYEQQRRAHRNTSSYQSPIYPPGTEYAVCLAEAQLMSAIVGVLNESLTEAIKSFYKLRKAYLTLESVMEAEKKYLNERSTSSLASSGSDSPSRPASRMSTKGVKTTASKPASITSTKGGSTLVESRTSTPETIPATASNMSLNESVPDNEANKANQKSKEDDDDDDFDFVDADEDHEGVETPMEYMGHLNVPTETGGSLALDNEERKIHVKSSSAPDLPADPYVKTDIPGPIEDFSNLTLSETIRDGEDISVYGDHPVDIFIISGSNFCFGILLLIISLVPPAFATLLKIVGFKGDRERGIQLLWQATKFHNIHGAMAGLVLFGYYNGISQFCDILPQSGEGSFPKERCAALLTEMRSRHPKSHLWLLEESRMLANEKQLEKAVAFMDQCSESPLKQLEALQWFERSLNTMFMHDYEGTSRAFLKCITLNNWSHGLYYFIAGASHVQLYRRHKTRDAKLAATHKEKAKEMFKKVAPNTGRKRFMAKQLPFDLFVNRKIAKWEARAKEWDCDLVDAIGVSPHEEMIYFWNGYKRMREDHLQASLENLAWSEGEENPYWSKEDLDEKGVLAVLRAATLRGMGRMAEAKELVQREVIKHDRALFKGPLKDAWTAPCARYEMAACVWREADAEGKPEDHADLLEECKGWLEEVAKWESFDLDARIGMKVTTGKGTLRRYGVEC